MGLHDQKITNNIFTVLHSVLPTVSAGGRRVFPADAQSYFASVLPPGVIVGAYPPDPRYGSSPSTQKPKRHIAKAVLVPTEGIYGFLNLQGQWQLLRFPANVIMPVDMLSPLTTTSGTDLSGAMLNTVYWLDDLKVSER